MALNKHQKLVKRLQQMKDEIDDFYAKVAKQMDIVQFHIYKKGYSYTDVSISENTFGSIVKSHHLGMQYCSPDPLLMTECSLKPSIGLAVKRPIYFGAEYRPPLEGIKLRHNWTVWGVKCILPFINGAVIENARQNAFLYCPSSSEITEVQFWFEGEERSNSFNYQLICFADESKEQKILGENLSAGAYALYEEIVKKWRENKFTNDLAAVKDTEGPFNAEFAPKRKDNFEKAYELVRRSIRGRKMRHCQGLRMLWLNQIKLQVMKNLSWTREKNEAFFSEWDENIFGTKGKGVSKTDGRWNQGKGVDCYTASRYIRYFVEEFLKNPDKKKHFGEAACILWVCVHASSEGKSNVLTLPSILSLNSKQIDPDQFLIQIGDVQIEITDGLAQLLQILMGEGRGKRGRRLFENITLDRLRDMLKMASKILLSAKSSPVSAEAFLIFPHIFEGLRMSKKQRKSRRVEMDQIKYDLCPNGKEIAAKLKSANSKYRS